MPDLSASWQISAVGTQVPQYDRTQPNAVGGRDLWREHGAESENACPVHVEPKPCVSALCLIVTHPRCPVARTPSGYADAAPPSAIINFRCPIWIAIDPPAGGMPMQWSG